MQITAPARLPTMVPKFWLLPIVNCLNCSWGVTKKAWPSKTQSFRNIFLIFCRKSKERNFDQDFYSLNWLNWLPLKWLILLQKRNETYMFATPFPTLLSFLPLPLESVKAEGRTGVPNFLASTGYHSLWGFAREHALLLSSLAIREAESLTSH